MEAVTTRTVTRNFKARVYDLTPHCNVNLRYETGLNG